MIVKLGGHTTCTFRWHLDKGKKPMHWSEKAAAILIAATVSHWMTVNHVFVCRASHILSAVPGSGMQCYQAIHLCMPRLWSQKVGGDVWNVVQHFKRNPIEPNIALTVPIRCIAVRKPQATGNGGWKRTNKAFKSWIYTRFADQQQRRWI